MASPTGSDVASGLSILRPELELIDHDLVLAEELALRHLVLEIEHHLALVDLASDEVAGVRRERG